MRKENKKKRNNKIIVIIKAILIIAFIITAVYLLFYFYNSYKNKKLYDDLNKTPATENTSVNTVPPADSELANKVKELQQGNIDVKGWISIDNTNINYPLLQGTDNDYYLTHNYKKETSRYGSIFINYQSDIKDVNSNVIIYGHNMGDSQMFGDLLKYENKDFYEQHPVIKIATDENEADYQIMYVFKSRVFYKNETNVFKYYQYYNFDNESAYDEYLNNCKKIELYDTGITAKYGDQLITLTTCEYSQDNGRWVVVAKKI